MEGIGAGRKDGKTRLAVIVLLLILVMIAGAFLILHFGGEEKEFQVGDYLKYETVGNWTGTVWVNVTAVLDDEIWFEAVWYHDNTSAEFGVQLYDEDEPRLIFWAGYGVSWLEEGDVTKETLNTSLGERSVHHYHPDLQGEVMDVYASTKGVVYSYSQTIGDEDWNVNAVLVETNIDWV